MGRTDRVATDTFNECQTDLVQKLHVTSVKVVTRLEQEECPLEKLYISELDITIAPPGKKSAFMRLFPSKKTSSASRQSLSDCLTIVSKTLESARIEELVEEMRIYRQTHPEDSDA